MTTEINENVVKCGQIEYNITRTPHIATENQNTSREGWEGVTQGSSTSQPCFLGPLSPPREEGLFPEQKVDSPGRSSPGRVHRRRYEGPEGAFRSHPAAAS